MGKKLETVNIQDVEVAAVGKWEGMASGKPATIVITHKDLEDMVAAFDELTANKKLNYEPPLKLGHDAKQKLLQEDGYPAAGWVTSLKKVGDKLVAGLKDVPKKIAELINAGAYKKISPEYYSDYKIGGKTYPQVFKAAALLGADIPAIKSTSDIAALYGSEAMLDENGVPYRSLFKLSESLTQQTMDIQDAWRANQNMPKDCWVTEVFDDHIIVDSMGQYFSVPYSVTDEGIVFALDQKQEVKRQVSYVAMAEAVTKKEDSIDFPAEAYAYVPDPDKPSEWKLRLWEDLEKKETAAQVGRAMAAFSPGGFRGQKVEIPSEDEEKVKAKIVAAWKRVNPDRDVGEMPDYMMQENIEEAKMDKELRELLGIDENADVLATVKALKEHANPDVVSLAEHQATENRVKALETQLAERKRDELITTAIQSGKLTPAQSKLPVLMTLAQNDPSGFQAFVDAQPVVIQLGEKGVEGGTPDEVQLTETETSLAEKLGIKKELMVAAKKGD